MAQNIYGLSDFTGPMADHLENIVRLFPDETKGSSCGSWFSKKFN